MEEAHRQIHRATRNEEKTTKDGGQKQDRMHKTYTTMQLVISYQFRYAFLPCSTSNFIITQIIQIIKDRNRIFILSTLHRITLKQILTYTSTTPLIYETETPT